MLRTGMGARSPVEVEVGSAQALQAPVTCVLPLHAVCASQLLGGCNTLLPVASAGRNRQECKRSRVRRINGPCVPSEGMTDPLIITIHHQTNMSTGHASVSQLRASCLKTYENTHTG